MGIVSKGIAALVILGIAWMLISGYGDARYDSGWQAATDAQRIAADELRQEAVREKADSSRRLAALQAELGDTMNRLRDVKEKALMTDESYKSWREQPIHGVAKCRIWGPCDP